MKINIIFLVVLNLILLQLSFSQTKASLKKQKPKNSEISKTKQCSGDEAVSLEEKIPERFWADFNKSADRSEIVKNSERLNNTDQLKGGMSADISYTRLPLNVKKVVKCSFPNIASDTSVRFKLTIVGNPFPIEGKKIQYVRNYNYSIETFYSNQVNKVPLPKLPTWSFIKQNKQFKLKNIEVLTWDEQKRTYIN